MRHWAVRHANDSVTYHISNGDDPSQEGIDPGVEVVETVTEKDPHAVWDFKLGVWTVDSRTETAERIGQADRVRSTQTCALMAPDKAYIYGRKHAEVIDHAGLNIALSDKDTKARFPFAHADARAHGDTIRDAMLRFASGLNQSLNRVAEIEARYQAAKVRKS